jgi:hypothetical protein
MTGAQRNAFELLNSTLRTAGFTGDDLKQLSAQVQDYLIQGYENATISVLLMESEPYKRRFKGNEERKKKGLPVLSPADYIGIETEFKNMFRQYGLPKDMFDSNEDLTKYISANVSADEMQDRLNIARSSVRSDDPAVRDTYRKWYAAGLNEGDALAAVLNPDKALPELERKARAAMFGGAASSQGLGLDQSRAEALANMGVNAENARQGFGQVADLQRNAGSIAGRYGLDYQGQEDAENAVFLNDAAATNRIKKLGQREAAEFGSRGAGDSRSISRGSY